MSYNSELYTVHYTPVQFVGRLLYHTRIRCDIFCQGEMNKLKPKRRTKLLLESYIRF